MSNEENVRKIIEHMTRDNESIRALARKHAAEYDPTKATPDHEELQRTVYTMAVELRQRLSVYPREDVEEATRRYVGTVVLETDTAMRRN